MPAIISHTPRKAYIERGVEPENTAPNSLDKALLKYAPDVPDGIVHLYGHTHGESPSLKSRAGVRFPNKGSIRITGAPLHFCPDAPEYRETESATAHRPLKGFSRSFGGLF